MIFQTRLMAKQDIMSQLWIWIWDIIYQMHWECPLSVVCKIMILCVVYGWTLKNSSMAWWYTFYILYVVQYNNYICVCDCVCVCVFVVSYWHNLVHFCSLKTWKRLNRIWHAYIVDKCVLQRTHKVPREFHLLPYNEGWLYHIDLKEFSSPRVRRILFVPEIWYPVKLFMVRN